MSSDIPCFKLVETEKTLAFLDINPLSRGHALVIPKFHGEKLTDIPDEHLSDILIPKPNPEEGLVIGWPQQATDMDKLKALFEDIKSKV
ncbi:hypothetical protein CHGG_09745 [Chaetomium globosum CBS 148.51]|uniref:HIT domain-containing protein n=1 Tax=Chaetomium globosum (strain ATCC 6205 / CBS 148.51 / DSM 1962 / NBRC 6347 / NRRL 1970) TaxID=306901 RepID=Q2GQK9_CHAGB|nr:uncharacterized protein CHGG_09745 [Chaetomium globosum CBS 148.51]EAQ83341.1 hypothetical protein CHGG_09745 [Chaetomium globosum CBS 148.51]